MQLAFGSGVMWGTPSTDANGTVLTNPTPVKFGVLQDVSIDFQYDIKELYGQLQLPVDIGRGKAKIMGKAKVAQINGQTFNSLFFGQTLTLGTQISDVLDTTGTLIPATPFQITVTPPNSGTYVTDLGVVDINGRPFTKVAAAPTAGQYSQAAAVYTFASADNVSGVRAFISYQYSFTGAPATFSPRSTINNLIMGAAPTFIGEFFITKNGKQFQMTLNSCVASKLSLPTKIDDYMVTELDFSAFASGVGALGSFSLAE